MLIWLKKWNIIKQKFIIIYKDGKEIITFGGTEIEKHEFYKAVLILKKDLMINVSTIKRFWKRK